MTRNKSFKFSTQILYKFSGHSLVSTYFCLENLDTPRVLIVVELSSSFVGTDLS